MDKGHELGGRLAVYLQVSVGWVAGVFEEGSSHLMEEQVAVCCPPMWREAAEELGRDVDNLAVVTIANYW